MFQGCVSVDCLTMKRVDIKTSRGKAEHHSKYREFRVKMKIHTSLPLNLKGLDVCMVGGNNWTRTSDPLHVKQVL